MTVTIFTQENCPGCRGTIRMFDKFGIPHTDLPLAENPDALKHFKVLGVLSAPIVVIGEGDYHSASKEDFWGGYRPDRIKLAVKRAAAA